jgi:hypothetical protein
MDSTEKLHKQILWGDLISQTKVLDTYKVLKMIQLRLEQF